MKAIFFIFHPPSKGLSCPSSSSSSFFFLFSLQMQIPLAFSNSKGLQFLLSISKKGKCVWKFMYYLGLFPSVNGPCGSDLLFCNPQFKCSALFRQNKKTTSTWLSISTESKEKYINLSNLLPKAFNPRVWRIFWKSLCEISWTIWTLLHVLQFLISNHFLQLFSYSARFSWDAVMNAILFMRRRKARSWFYGKVEENPNNIRGLT